MLRGLSKMIAEARLTCVAVFHDKDAAEGDQALRLQAAHALTAIAVLAA